MKKLLIVVAIFMLILINHKEENIIIPENAIRFRVIANSNNVEDQYIKNKISKNLENYIMDLTSNSKSSKDANEVLLNNYDNIKKYVDNYLDINNINTNYDISIGRNYFPTKSYKGVEYQAGYYDSLVLSLGHKQGVNWWCVIYPPLCLIDNKEELSDIEYTSYVSEMLQKYNLL